MFYVSLVLIVKTLFLGQDAEQGFFIQLLRGQSASSSDKLMARFFVRVCVAVHIARKTWA